MSFFSLFKKNKVKKKAAVFIDFEHWYIALDKNLGLKPDIKSFTNELERQYNVAEMTFFGDFSNPSLNAEMHRIRGFTNKIVETNNGGGYFKKDFTDFIMLDHIYRNACLDKNIDTYVIFTGDGHFSSVVLFLKNFCNKEVVVYGVKNAFSGQLKQAASRYVEIGTKQDKTDEYCKMILSNMYSMEQKHKNPRLTFVKTVSAVAKNNSVPEQEIKLAMEKLLHEGYVTQYETLIGKRQVRLLKAHFGAAEKSGLFIIPKDKKRNFNKG